MNTKSLNKPLQSNQRVNRFEYPTIENHDFLVVSQKVVHSKVPYFTFNLNEPPSFSRNDYYPINQFINHKPPSFLPVIYLPLLYALLLPFVPLGSAFDRLIQFFIYLAVGGFMISCGLLLANIKNQQLVLGGTYEFRNL